MTAPVNVARSIIAFGLKRSWQYHSTSARTRRPSASVFKTSIVWPDIERTMSPGRCAAPDGMFSTRPTRPTALTRARRAARRRISPMTTPAPAMSHFMSHMPPAGLIEMPPVSKVTPLPIKASGATSAATPRYCMTTTRGVAADVAPLAFIGKGVTFDTGGISIKPAGGMADMKWDMAGAGVVIGLMRLLAARKARVNAVGIVGLVENMPSGNAQRPGDIVRSMSGQTIEVLNTDAEGRLVLADVLWYCQDRFKPKLMIDLATLTGAVIVALGHENAGLFANNDELAERLTAAGKAVGEPVWRLPLGDSYDRAIDSDAADVKNIAGDRAAGSIIGAQFVQRFVNKVPWAHLDIAGVAWSKKDAPTVPKGATAFGVRLLDRFAADYYETE